MSKKLLLLIAPAFFASACTPVEHSFGDTHRWNIEQQVVDPDPEYAGQPMEGGSGERGVAAHVRYVTGNVIQPRPSTTNGNSNSGSSSSSSSTSSSGGPQ